MIERVSWKRGDMRRMDRRMKERLRRLSNFRDMYAPAVAVVDRAIQKNFESDGALFSDGGRWAPLKPSTIRGRRRGSARLSQKQRAARVRAGRQAGTTVDILRDRGWLKNKWKHLWTRDKVAVQSGVKYGIYHDSDKPRKRLPQRKIVPRDRHVAPDINKAMRWQLRKALR